MPRFTSRKGDVLAHPSFPPYFLCHWDGPYGRLAKGFFRKKKNCVEQSLIHSVRLYQSQEKREWYSGILQIQYDEDAMSYFWTFLPVQTE